MKAQLTSKFLDAVIGRPLLFAAALGPGVVLVGVLVGVVMARDALPENGGGRLQEKKR